MFPTFSNISKSATSKQGFTKVEQSYICFHLPEKWPGILTPVADVSPFSGPLIWRIIIFIIFCVVIFGENKFAFWVV